MTMLRVGIDLDDVVFNLLDKWLEFYNLEYNDNIKKSEITEFDLNKARFQCSNIYQYLYDPRLHLECREKKEVRTSLFPVLKDERIDVTFCTSAPRTVMPAKIHRLETMFPSSRFAYGFYMTTHKYHIGCDAYVEDAPHHIQDMFDTGAHVIVFDQPWNKHLTAAPWRESWKGAYGGYEYRLLRANNWSTIKDLIFELV